MKQALLLLAVEGQDECVKILLNQGACVNTSDKKDCRAVMFATEKGHDRCVKSLYLTEELM